MANFHHPITTIQSYKIFDLHWTVQIRIVRCSLTFCTMSNSGANCNEQVEKITRTYFVSDNLLRVMYRPSHMPRRLRSPDSTGELTKPPAKILRPMPLGRV